MSQLPLRQMEGAKDLLQDAVEATVTAVADIHIDLAQRTYDTLALVPPLAPPVRAVERVHLGLTQGVYTTIRAANRLAGALAHKALQRLDQQDDEL